MPIPCVDIVIKQNGKILMGKRTNKPVKGFWWFPGGRINKGETLEEAAIRKIKQEIGIDVKKVKQLGVEETIFKNDGPFGWTTHTINIVFLVEFKKDEKIILDEQHSEFKWFLKIEKDFHSYLKKFIKLAK